MYCQSFDSIKINVDLTSYKVKANLNLKERYKYTCDNLDSIKQIFNPNKFKFLISYKIDSLYIKSIPQFTIKKDAKICRRVNFINYINFENNFENQYFNIYLKDKLLMNTRYLQKKKSDIVNFSLIEYDFNNPGMYGGLHGYLIKLMLEKKFFIFMINGFGDTCFLFENNKIYAIYNPDNYGNFEKMEMNKFMSKIIGKKKLKLILKGISISTINTNSFNVNSYFDKNYSVLFNGY